MFATVDYNKPQDNSNGYEGYVVDYCVVQLLEGFVVVLLKNCDECAYCEEHPYTPDFSDIRIEDIKHVYGFNPFKLWMD